MAVAVTTGKGRRSQGCCPGPGEPALRWLGPRWALAGRPSEGREVRWPCVACVLLRVTVEAPCPHPSLTARGHTVQGQLSCLPLLFLPELSRRQQTVSLPSSS